MLCWLRRRPLLCPLLPVGAARMFCGTGMPKGCLGSLTCFSFSTGKAMMPLNLKSTRHLLTTPDMQAKDTEDTLAS